MCTYAVEPVYSSHLGDRRKWLLKRGFKQESMYDLLSARTKKLAVAER